MNCFLGLDTSCYTTSVAAVDQAGSIVAAQRRLLLVAPGERGLRQQEMVFQHLRNLPELIHNLMKELPAQARIAACAASLRPRPEEQSYMPAFSVGDGFGRALADAMRVPFFGTSHQQGHIAAALLGSGLESPEFMALHLSGGTTELLRIAGEEIACIGGTQDISFGQLVDRTGVALGLPFPAGPNLEALARQALERGKALPDRPGVSVRGLSCSASGAEAELLRGDMEPAGTALAVYSFLVRSTLRLLEAGRAATGMERALLFGGVASSLLFRDLLRERIIKRRSKMQIFFGRSELSGDNAVGVAHIALQKYKGDA